MPIKHSLRLPEEIPAALTLGRRTEWRNGSLAGIYLTITRRSGATAAFLDSLDLLPAADFWL